MGAQLGVVSVCIDADDDMTLKEVEIDLAIRAVDRGRGVVVVTDMAGGTPSNLAGNWSRPGRVVVIAGVNLPMLVKLAQCRAGDFDLQEVAARAVMAACKYVVVVNSLGPQRPAGTTCQSEQSGEGS